MSIQSWLEQEEQQLENEFQDGLISRSEYNKQMKELQRDARDAAIQEAEEAAERAYNDVLCP